MTNRILLLLLFLFPILCRAQACLDIDRDCSNHQAIDTLITISFICNDTLELAATPEVCNDWQIPSILNHTFNADSSLVYLIPDNCQSFEIGVIGTTTTLSDNESATCASSFHYQVQHQVDTISQYINCFDYIALEQTYEILRNDCGCDSLITQYTTDIEECIPCGKQCIYISGTATISGGDTDGAEVIVTYSINGDTLTTGSPDWLGGVEIAECFARDDTIEIINVQAFLPQGGSGSASADAWIFVSPNEDVMTSIDTSSCLLSEIGLRIDTLQTLRGCDSIVIINTELLPPPTLLLLPVENACAGDTIHLTPYAPDAISYLWNNGYNTPTLSIDIPGVYTLTITDSNGCKATTSTEIFFNDIGINITTSIADSFVLSYTPLEVWEGSAIELNAEISGTTAPVEIIWNTGPEIGDSTFNYIARTSDTIQVTAIDTLGCFHTDYFPFFVRPGQIFIPNAFSPNGDNINDYFTIYSSPNITEMRFQLFSRGGHMVFDQHLNYASLPHSNEWQIWDGYFNGKKMLPQVFAYQIFYRTIRGEWQIRSGDITLYL